MSEHELWNELGNLYFMSGAYNQAEYAYRRSMKLDAGFGRPYSNLALTYVQQGRYDDAIELYRRSIELLAEDKEKAISLNRLGAVYRHLKDYSRAVIAFQEADELDPNSAGEFPLTLEEAPESVPTATAPDELPVVEGTEAAELKSEPEWWDFEQPPASASATELAVVVDPEADPNASWTPADLSEFQADLSQPPGVGSLTTWGGEVEEDFEVFPPIESEPELPDPDGDLSKWLPLPEEAPLDLDDVRVQPFFDEGMEALDDEPDWNEPSAYHVIESADHGPLLSAASSSLTLFAAADDPARASQQTWNVQELEVDVEERPAPDVKTLPHEEISSRIEIETAVGLAEPDTQSVVALPISAEECASDRDEDMREIEMGIARFRRVVQLNPRNAHAWDALGTLYKSAGLYKDAILSYQQAISNDPSKSLYYHHLGLVYACEGRDEDAIGAFQRVIEIDPEYSLAHATLGGYYRKMGLEELAQKHIGKAMKNIFDSENEYNRACLEAICGNTDQAIELLGVALKNKQTYVDWILRDPDLDFIRQDPRFKQLISDYTR